MQFLGKRVEKYFFSLYPNHATPPPNHDDCHGAISLYCEKEYKLFIYFRDSVELPKNSYDSKLKTGVTYQSFARYKYYVDMLRNEESVFVIFKWEGISYIEPYFILSTERNIQK